MKSRSIVVTCICIFCWALTATAARAQITHRGLTQTLTQSGASFYQVMGDMVYANGEAVAVHMRPETSGLGMVFHRFSADAAVTAEKIFPAGTTNYYSPNICFDGARFAIVASTLTRSVFMTVDAAGNYVLAPRELPDIPYGGRTAGFKVYWTGAAYAVFGLILEPQYEGQDLSYGNFYTHFHYWLLKTDGTVSVSRQLGMLAPITYPGIEGAEREYYDAAWTGTRWFVAWYAESQSGPPLSTYIRTFDINGNLVKAEAPAFANTTAKGAKVAFSGTAVAVIGLKEVTLGGNFIYLRCFAPDGTPLAAETQINARTLGGLPTGFGPGVFWLRDRFVTIYCAPDYVSYGLYLSEFAAGGARICAEYPLRNQAGGAVTASSLAFGVDVQLVGNNERLWLKNQYDPTGYLITVQPRIHALEGDYLTAAQVADHLLGKKILPAYKQNSADFNQDGTIDCADVVARVNQGY